MRVQDHDVDVRAAAHRLDRRRAGVAARRADDRDPLAALAEHVVEEPADELQGDVLERQRRPVEQLGQPLPRVDLDERDDSRVAERRVGLVAQPGEIGWRDVVADERA